jgi:hypothetical protein
MALCTFHPLLHLTQPGESVLPNVSLKRIQLPRRIRSTSTAAAGAATAAAGALLNAPILYSCTQFSCSYSSRYKNTNKYTWKIKKQRWINNLSCNEFLCKGKKST